MNIPLNPRNSIIQYRMRTMLATDTSATVARIWRATRLCLDSGQRVFPMARSCL